MSCKGFISFGKPLQITSLLIWCIYFTRKTLNISKSNHIFLCVYKQYAGICVCVYACIYINFNDKKNQSLTFSSTELRPSVTRPLFNDAITFLFSSGFELLELLFNELVRSTAEELHINTARLKSPRWEEIFTFLNTLSFIHIIYGAEQRNLSFPAE